MKLALLLTLTVVAACCARLAAENNLPVDSWVWPEIERFEAAGLTQSTVLTALPASRSAAALALWEAQTAAGDRTAFLSSFRLLEDYLAADLQALGAAPSQEYFQPLDTIRLRYVFKDGGTDIENDLGRSYTERSNVFLDLGAGFEKGRLSGRVMWEAYGLEGAGSDASALSNRFDEAYIRADMGKWYIEAGREPLWWGPGRHGALLLSDNAKPFDLVRFGNDVPVLLPGILSKLGLVSVELFVTRLEKQRVVPEPYLMGIRVDFKVSPHVELGLLRTAMFGGEGRDVTWGTIWDVLTARHENDPEGAGNQLASAYWKLTAPLGRYSFVFYGEFGGEDQADPAYFTKPALIAGLYFPTAFGASRLDLCLEYADTYMDGHEGQPEVWYTHGVYQTGYRYNGRIIGHHIGTDARDAYVELGARLWDSARLWAAYDFEQRELYQAFPEEHEEISLGLEWRREQGIAVQAAYTREWIRNFGFTQDDDREGSRFTIGFERCF
jgi:hypothetical protein